jgi:hypothetical protein
MKLTSTSKWILTIGIIVAALIAVGVLYGSLKASQNDLKQDIEQAESDYTQYTGNKTRAEADLETIYILIPEQEGQFYSPNQTVEIEQHLLAAADFIGIDVSNISLSSPVEEAIGTITYKVYSITITAHGEKDDLLSYCNRLSGIFLSSTIEAVSLSVPEGCDGCSDSSLSLRIKVYTSDFS